MDVSQAAVFDSEERLSKVFDSIMKSGTAVFVTRDKKLFGLIDDRNIRPGRFSDPSSVKCGNASVKCPSVGEGAQVAELLEAFLSGHFKAIPVIDEDARILGMVARADLLRELARLKLISHAPVIRYMKKPVITIDEGKTVGDAKSLISKEGVHHLAVTRNGMIVGVVSVFDFLGFLTAPKGRQSFQFISEVKNFSSRNIGEMAREPVSVQAAATLEEAAQKMADANVSVLLVMDGRKLAGTISATDIFKLVRSMSEKKMEVIIGGLDEDSLIYHDQIKETLISTFAKFEKSFKIESPSVQMKKGKSIYALHVHFRLNNRPIAFVCEGYNLAEAIACISHQLKVIFEKAKSEKMERRKGEREEP